MKLCAHACIWLYTRSSIFFPLAFHNLILQRKVETKSSRISPCTSSSRPVGPNRQPVVVRVSVITLHVARLTVRSKVDVVAATGESRGASRRETQAALAPIQDRRLPNILNVEPPALALVAAGHLEVLPALIVQWPIHGAHHKKSDTLRTEIKRFRTPAGSIKHRKADLSFHPARCLGIASIGKGVCMSCSGSAHLISFFFPIKRGSAPRLHSHYENETKLTASSDTKMVQQDSPGSQDKN